MAYPVFSTALEKCVRLTVLWLLNSISNHLIVAFSVPDHFETVLTETYLTTFLNLAVTFITLHGEAIVHLKLNFPGVLCLSS